jgi:hypothetical protein
MTDSTGKGLYGSVTSETSDDQVQVIFPEGEEIVMSVQEYDRLKIQPPASDLMSKEEYFRKIGDEAASLSSS